MKKQVVFMHQTYPAQFGPISQFLLRQYDVDVSFISEYADKPLYPGIKHYAYKPAATGHDKPYFFSRHFEQEVASMHGIYNVLKATKIQPDVLIGHVAFGNMGLLHVEYPEATRIGFFELFYDPSGKYAEHRPEYPSPKPNRLRVPLRNATQLIELEYCTKGYSPTPFQKLTYPKVYQDKLSVIFDGIDVNFYKPGEAGVIDAMVAKTNATGLEASVLEGAGAEGRNAGVALLAKPSDLKRTWPADAKVVTYVSRGLEAMRGFDVFMEVAHKISQKRDDVHFVIAGNPKTHYGSEMINIKEPTFKDYVLKQHPYDLNRFHFLDWVSPAALLDLFRLSDCHFYWTVPFTLSWSLFQAMASGCLVMGSDSAPVHDAITQGVTGLLVDPNDKDAIANLMLEVLSNGKSYNQLRDNARQSMVENYSFEVCLPKLAKFYLGA